MRETETGKAVRALGFALLLCAAAGLSGASAADRVSSPIFAPSSTVGWIGYGPEYMPVENAPRPVASDPAHPYVPNAIEYLSARPNLKVVEQSTFPVADLTNPILQPWVRDELGQLNARVLAGHPVFEHRASCWPAGVPAFLLAVVNPIFFIQTPTQVTMISQGGDHTVRRVHLNASHSPRPTPSWFGDSVGHYEGDTLVVDTIGLNAKTYVDVYRTPHSEQLHVIERFRLIEDGRTLEVEIYVEDPVAFTAPWRGTQRFVRSDRGPLLEAACAENNANYFNHDFDPMPIATRPDF
jgi:hypothetical protein